ALVVADPHRNRAAGQAREEIDGQTQRVGDDADAPVPVDGEAREQKAIDVAAAPPRRLLAQIKPRGNAPRAGAQRFPPRLVAQIDHELLQIVGAEIFALEKTGTFFGDVVHVLLAQRSRRSFLTVSSSLFMRSLIACVASTDAATLRTFSMD